VFIFIFGLVLKKYSTSRKRAFYSEVGIFKIENNFTRIIAITVKIESKQDIL